MVLGRSASLFYDLEKIGGLPILGYIYEEFLPRNEDLVDAEKYAPVVLELLRTHAEVCRFHKSNHVCWNWWLDHFYRGEVTWVLLEKNQKRGHCLALHKSLKGIAFRL